MFEVGIQSLGRASANWLPLCIVRLTGRSIAIIRRGVHYMEPNMVPIGLCGAIMFPAYWLVWAVLFPQPYESLAMRFAGGVLAVILALKNWWPVSVRPYLPLFWLGTLLYTLPFFFTFMLLQNGASTIWLMSFLGSLFLLVLLVDWLSLTLLFVTGTILAWIAHVSVNPQPVPPDIYFEYFPIFVFVLVGGTIFSYNTEALRRAHQRAQAEVGSTMARELRSPLLGLKTSEASLRRYLPVLLQGYDMARHQQLQVGVIQAAHLNALRQIPNRISEETNQINIITDMLLMSGGEAPRTAYMQSVSMAACLEQTVRQFSVTSDLEHGRIVWRRDADFWFTGSDALMRRVLHDLLRKLIVSKQQSGREHVAAEIHTVKDWHCLQLRLANPDGAKPLVLPRARTRDSSPGDDPALAFCRMTIEQFGGRLSMRSELGALAEIGIWFPRGVAAGEPASPTMPI